jgi:acetoin utilization deacetylase AcuC-like enzyme
MRVHKRRMIKSLAESCAQGGGIIDPAPTFLRPDSLESALRAAGGAIDCVRQVWRGEANNAFALVRPPGHHAEPDRAMGFCLLNNAAIAAAAALADGARRVAIIDYDAHHGNGTQAVFLEDPRVAFLSMHQWGIYPGTGWYEEAAEARGRIVNVPLPARSGDRTYGRVAEEIVAPLVRGFRPDLMLVSAGFDAHWNDPITSLGLSSAGFHSLSRRLVELADEQCGGKIVFVLEGGYEPLNVARGAMSVFAALTDGVFDDPGDECPHKDPELEQLIDKIRSRHGFQK